MDSSVAGSELTRNAANEETPAWKITVELDKRKQKQRFVKKFRRSYTYSGSNVNIEQRTCIWSGGSYSWRETYLGLIWVAVHGINSVCVVTRNRLDMTRVVSRNYKSKPRKELLHDMMRTLVYEIEDDIQSVKKPFGVVSVTTDRKRSRSEAVVAKCDKKEAIDSDSSTKKTKSNSIPCPQAVDAKCDEKEAIESDSFMEKTKSNSIPCIQAVDAECDEKEAIDSDSSMEKTKSNTILCTHAVDAKCDEKAAIVSDSSTKKTKSNSIPCTLQAVDAKCDEKAAIDSDSDSSTKKTKSNSKKTKSNSTCPLSETTQALGAKYDKKEAANFLAEKLKSVSAALTFDETIQTAIAAFQHMCHQKFKAADEILVSVMKDSNSTAVYSLEADDIEKHLAVVNNTEGLKKGG